MNRAGRSTVVLASAVVALTAPLILTAASADAAGQPARIQGSHSTKLTITKKVNIFGDKNKTGTKNWVMTPKCGSGACNTTLKRPSIQSSTVFTSTLVPQANGTYKSTQAGTSDCISSNGSVLATNAYTTSTVIVLTPTTTTGGLVTKYKGTFKYTLTRRASAPKSCAATGEEDGTFISPP